MDLMPEIMSKLYHLRQSRLGLIDEYLNVNDPELMNKIIADAINALENLFIYFNLPQEGFYPNTPPKEE